MKGKSDSKKSPKIRPLEAEDASSAEGGGSASDIDPIAAARQVIESVLPSAETITALAGIKYGSSDSANDVDPQNVEDDSHFVRRSERNPERNMIERADVKKILSKILQNDESTRVLKLKDYLLSDISPSVLESILQALFKNTVCQALYVQNVSSAMLQPQLDTLIKLLKEKMIWCLNIGENYEISLSGWTKFCEELPNTNVTHLYVSEHVIPLELKNKMREYIRLNRSKHDLHCSESNLDVIEKCTHCWWNPINSIRHRQQQEAARKEAEEEAKRRAAEDKKRKKSSNKARSGDDKSSHGSKKARAVVREPEDWEGERWKFSCNCGEVCSYYENPRYHPKGPQFECTRCKNWCHVKCVFGSLTAADLEEMPETLCVACQTAKSREERYKCFWVPPLSTPSAISDGGDL